MSNQPQFTPENWRLIKGSVLQYGVQMGNDGGFMLNYGMPNAKFNALLITQSQNLYHALDESTQCMEIMLRSLERNGYDTSGIEIQLEKNKAVIIAALGE